MTFRALDYAGLAALFGRSVRWIKDSMPQWERRGFPAPLPWSRRKKLWNREAVEAWKTREERRSGSLGPPDLKIVDAT